MSASRNEARLLMRESLARGEPLGWFEPLYAEADESHPCGGSSRSFERPRRT